MKVAYVLGFLVFPSCASGQAGPPQCPTATFFEFQTTRPASFLGDSGLVVHPLPVVPKPRNLVQFVVDTTGVVMQSTFKVLKAADQVLAAQARGLLGQWRYSPAMVGECRVRQVVQTPIGSG